MRPEQFKDEGPALEAYKEAQTRENMTQEIMAERQAVTEEAWKVMGTLVGQDNLTEAITGCQQSPIVVLENREDEEVGKYAIVGRLDIEFKNRERHGAEATVTFKIGTGFRDIPAVADANKLRPLGGFSRGEKVWFGTWQDQESTDEIDTELQEITDWHSADRIPVYTTLPEAKAGGLRKLAALRESLSHLERTAQDKELNPRLAGAEEPAAA